MFLLNLFTIPKRKTSFFTIIIKSENLYTTNPIQIQLIKWGFMVNIPPIKGSKGLLKVQGS